MASLLSLERFLPPYRYHQREVTELGARVAARARARGRGASDADGRSERLLAVYETAGVETRASVVPIEEVFHPATSRPRTAGTARSPAARARTSRRRALAASGLQPSEIGLVVSVSCTGFMIPAVDAYVAEALGLGPRLARLPITGVRLRGRRRGPGARRRLPDGPPRERRARAGARVLEPDLPALRPLADQRRLDRDLRRRRRRRGAGGRAPSRAPARRTLRRARRREPASSPAPRTSWASSSGTRACRSSSTGASRRSCGARSARRSRPSWARAASRARTIVALHPPPRRPARDRGDGRAAGPAAEATWRPPRRCSPSTAT